MRPEPDSRTVGVVRILRYVVVVLAVSVAACGNGDNGAAGSSRCEPVSAAMVDAIATGLTVNGGGSLRAATAVKSNDHVNAYFIAADIQGPGMMGTKEVGVWTSNSLEPGRGSIAAVDGHAKEFSDWGTIRDVSQSDDGVSEARSCTKNALP